MSANRVRIGAVEKSRIGGDAEAALQSFLNAFDRKVVSAFAADREVVVLALAVNVNRERQVLARLEEIELLFQQQRVGAEINIFFALDQAGDDLTDLRMHKRLAARN